MPSCSLSKAVAEAVGYSSNSSEENIDRTKDIYLESQMSSWMNEQTILISRTISG